MSTTIRHKNISIRKPRKCFGCLGMLEKGDYAYTQTNVAEGKIYTLTFCPTCEEKICTEMRYDDEFGEGDLATRKD